MATPVSQYFARVAIDVDQSSLKKVDEYFKSLESKMKRYQGKLGSGLRVKVTIDIDSRSTLLNMRRKLDMLGQNLTLTVKRLQFAINGKQIRSQAEKQLSAGLRVKITPWIARTTIADLRNQIHRGLQNIPVTVKYSGNLRASLMSRINQFITPAARPQKGSGGSSGRGGGGNRGRGGLGFPSLSSGPVGWALRAGTGAIPFVGGAVGVNALNQANTDYQSQKIAANGVFANSLPGGGSAARQQLFNLAQQDGIDYKETLPNFVRFMASAMPSLGYDSGFNVFKSVLEFGRARGSTGESLERALVALSQMAGKGKIMSEELFGQLAEATGFGESSDIFALAYAQKTKSGLTGQKAQAALRDAMKKGNVLSSDILPLVAQIMAERAAPSLEASRNSSTARQMRFRNSRQKFIEKWSEAGGEAALSKMWDSLAMAMDSLSKRAPELATAFSNLVDIFDTSLKTVLDLSNTLWNGVSTKTSDSIQDATGINLVAIRDGIQTMVGFLAGIANSLGVTGSIAAIAGVYGVTKIGTAFAKNKVGQAIAEKTGGLLGTSNNLSAYAVPGVGALKVWVVNGGSAFDMLPGGKTTTPTTANTGSKLKDLWTKTKSGGWAFLSNPATILGGVLGAASYLHPDQNSVGVNAPFDVMGGSDAAMWAMTGGADRFVNKNISQMAPVVDQAKQATVNHDIQLKADIKIEAGTTDEALQKFKSELNGQLFEPFMLQSLREAQSTVGDYAR